MKKALAVLLLVIGNMAAVCALSAVSLFIILMSFDFNHLLFNLAFTLLIGLAAVIALGFASSRLLPVFERKYSLKEKRFILAAYVSPIIGAAVYWGVCWLLDAAGHQSGWSEVGYTTLLPLTAAAYLISGWAWVSSVTSRSNANRSPK